MVNKLLLIILDGVPWRNFHRLLRVDPYRRSAGYEVIVTADHGQDARGHHDGRADLQQDSALYYFGPAKGPVQDILIDQLQLAPTILTRLGAPAPESMKAAVFLS